MTPRGYYSGTGPWWLRILLPGWEGKVFYPDGRGLNVCKKGPKLPFSWAKHYRDDTVMIVYDPPYSRITDVITLEDEVWKGEIFAWGVKVGTFRLMRGGSD